MKSICKSGCKNNLDITQVGIDNHRPNDYTLVYKFSCFGIAKITHRWGGYV